MLRQDANRVRQMGTAAVQAGLNMHPRAAHRAFAMRTERSGAGCCCVRACMDGTVGCGVDDAMRVVGGLSPP